MATGSVVVQPSKPALMARTIVRNASANALRIAVTSLVAIFLPAYLTRRLPVAVYGAWVLILQLSAYVGYLDFGVQTAVAKHIAEYEARGDGEGSCRCASAGFAITVGAAILGLLLTGLLAWQVPHFFRAMPPELFGDVRTSVLFVGSSLCVVLAASVFAALFLGLQRYEVTMIITIAGRLLFGAMIWLAAEVHGSLVLMGAIAASVNMTIAGLQVAAWRKLASRIRVSLRSIDRGMLANMLKYCAIMTVWSVCMLFISGLDLTIVGHYSFGETAYYAVANSPTSVAADGQLGGDGSTVAGCVGAERATQCKPDGKCASPVHSLCRHRSLVDRFAVSDDRVLDLESLGRSNVCRA